MNGNVPPGRVSTNRGSRGCAPLGAVLGLSLILLGCQDVRTTGYLSQGPPRHLQFAPPIQYVALPPLPKTSDPQPPMPILNVETEPSQIVGSTPQNPAPREAVGSAPVPNATGTGTNQQPVKVDLTLQSSGLLTPDMLLRFFPTGKPAGFELPVGQAIPFQAPVLLRPPSAATYEVK
jgi:hypothetical protein